MSSWLEPVRRNRLVILGAGVLVLLASAMAWGLCSPRHDRFVEAIHQRGYPASAAELDAWYLAVPDTENLALKYTNAIAGFTNTASVLSNFLSRSWLPPIGQGFTPDEQSELKAILATNEIALRLLYAAPATGRSRYPIHLTDGPMTLLPHLYQLKQAISMLSAEGLLHATEGDAEQATRSFLVAGRMADSLSEEPIVISQLVRYVSWASVLQHLERALALTHFTEEQLASLQRVIEPAERPRAAARAWAGEQAIHMSVFNERKMTRMAFREAKTLGGLDGDFPVSASLSLLRFTGILEKDKAYFCNEMARELDALELAYLARVAACQRVAAVTNMPARLFILSRMLLPALKPFQLRDANHVALVRTAAAALAIERYRLAHTNALPASLEQLTPCFCQSVPADPYDGRPLRYKAHDASFAVYSIGSDGRDDGGVAWESNYVKIPQDVGFLVKH